jgi:hypothetical protein
MAVAKHCNLLRYGNNYGSKKFYYTGPWCDVRFLFKLFDILVLYVILDHFIEIEIMFKRQNDTA